MQTPLLKAVFVGPHGVRAGWRFALFNLLFFVFASGLLFLRRFPHAGRLHAAWDYAETFIYGVPDSAKAATGHLLNPHFERSRWITGGNVGPEGSVLAFGVYGLAALLFVLFYAKRPWQTGN